MNEEGNLAEGEPNTDSRYSELVDGSHKYTDVYCRPKLGPGGAHHFYEVRRKNGPVVMMRFSFQNGPIKEAGVNGVMNEDLLAIVIDRLKGFQAGKYACKENAAALEDVEDALEVLKDRTKERESRGVEGTHKI